MIFLKIAIFLGFCKINKFNLCQKIAPTFDIDDKTRVIILHQDAEMKPTRIHKITKVPLSTIEDWIKKLDQGIDIRVHRGHKDFNSNRTT